MTPSDYIAIAGILTTVSLALLGGVFSMVHKLGRRVHDLEVTINNGLCRQVDGIHTIVEEIRQHLMWDGKSERRTNESSG